MRNYSTIYHNSISELPEDNGNDRIKQLEKELAAEKMKQNNQKYLQMHENKISQTKDGRWATNVYDSSGKRKTIACTSLEQLHSKLIEHYRKVEADQAITFSTICKEWLDEKIKHKEITPASYAKYLSDHKRFFIDRDHEFNRMPIASITDGDLRRFIKDTIVDLALTKKTYNQMQILLKGALLYAKQERYTNFSAGTFFLDLVLSDRLFVRKAKPNDETQVFNDAEAQKLIDHFWNEHDIRGLGLILMFQTGMRVGELAALKHENLKNGTIRITATEEYFIDPKTGKKICDVVDHAKTDAGDRTIILPEGADKTLRAIRALNPFGEYLFSDSKGRRIRGTRFNYWLHSSCRKVGIPERSTHKIRKTYASVLLSNQVDERLIMSQMGHSDIATTRKIYYYNRNSEDERKKIISKVINY